MALKRQNLLERISCIQEAIDKATEYLVNGKHAQWRSFRPIVTPKLRDDVPVPPHRDWVKNVFLPRMQRSLHYSEKVLEKLAEPARHKPWRTAGTASLR